MTVYVKLSRFILWTICWFILGFMSNTALRIILAGAV